MTLQRFRFPNGRVVVVVSGEAVVAFQQGEDGDLERVDDRILERGYLLETMLVENQKV